MSLLYSRITKLSDMRERFEEYEKELYSKECVAECINFVVGQASEEVVDLKSHERFACNLATILARDREVVAVWVFLSKKPNIFLAKNFAWSKSDEEYIERITNYLKAMSNSAPTILSDIEEKFTKDVMFYCSDKLRKRVKKLMNDVQDNRSDKHIESFHKYYSTKVNGKTNMYKLSQICNDYYKEIKKNKDTTIHPKFLGHIKKVGSYTGSMIDIIECARNVAYKELFTNAVVHKGKSDVIMDRPIYSWKNIINKFVDNNDDYDRFMKKCSEKYHVTDRMEKVYTDKATHKLQQFDGDNDVKQQIYLHAEMRILSLIIERNHKHKEFIAVSKRCCYLCEMYIDFARTNGYNIIVSGNHRKLYSGWKLPHVNDESFKVESLAYLLDILNRIIDNKIKHYTRSLKADSDSGGNSPDSENLNKGEYMTGYYDRVVDDELDVNVVG